MTRNVWVLGVVLWLVSTWPFMAAAQPALMIQSVSPLEVDSGTVVTIRGSGFGPHRQTVQVLVGGAAMPLQSVSPHEIRFTVPPGTSSGPVTVVRGGLQALAPQPLTVVAALRIASITPGRGGVGTQVTLRGEGFDSPPHANRVTLSGVACPVLAGNATQLRIRVPAGAQSGLFEVTTASGRQALSSEAFGVEGAAPLPPAVAGHGRPVIERMEPSSGPPGTVVRIMGRNFSRDMEVWLGGMPATISEFLPTRLTVVVPEGGRSAPFTLRGRFTAESREPFRVEERNAPPTVVGIAPLSGPPGTLVTLTGQRFSARPQHNRVTLAGRPCPVRSATPEQLVIIVPAGASSDRFAVEVAGAGSALSPQRFAVYDSLEIASVEPPAGPEGTRVTLRGAGLAPSPGANRLTLGGQTVPVVSATETELVFVVPRGAQTGPLEVEARGMRWRAREFFRVTSLPVIQRFAPESGPPGTDVSLVGENFGQTTRTLEVRLGGALCPVLSVGPTQTTVRVPEGAASGHFEVTVHGQGAARASRPFTVQSPVVIRSFAPSRGPVGTVVTVQGEGFGPSVRAVRVRMGERVARVVAVGENEVRFEVPDGAEDGPFEVTVRRRGAGMSPEPFSVIEQPTIADFRPRNGGPGTEVVIDGTRFGQRLDGVTVTLGGRPCRVLSVGPTRLTVQIPPDASSGRFLVTLRGQGTVEANADFEVLAPLAVHAFLPTSGAPGTEVTLRGSGFPSGPRHVTVLLGETRLPVLVAAADELRVRIPDGSRSGPFRVQVRSRRGGREAVSRDPFQVTPPLGVSSLSPAVGSAGTEVRLQGWGFQRPGLVVNLNGLRAPHRLLSDQELVVTIPAGARTGTLVVNARGLSPVASPVSFTVDDGPVITSVEPSSGPAGTMVVIRGIRFSTTARGNDVRLNRVPLPVVAARETELHVRIPPNAPSGLIEVTVEGRGRAVAPQPFRRTR